MLKGGDRVGVREGSLEMREDVRCRPARGSSGQIGRRAPSCKRRADLALPQVEPSPDALQGPVTEVAVASAAGGEDRAGDGMLEEAPQTAGGQAEPSDFVGVPGAEGASATRTSIAVAAKDPPGAFGFAPGAAIVKSIQVPCRFSVPTTLQCGQGVCLSRSAIAFHSSALRKNHRCSPTGTTPRK